MNVYLCPMTKELARIYFRSFVVDPALFTTDQKYRPYIYNEENVDARIERYRALGCAYLAVMLNGEPIGDIVFKHINREHKHCTLGLSLRSDDVKNQGYGTQAEILALQYAFDVLDMETVFADALIHNTRSQHVLRKVGFQETHRDDTFIYYRCDRNLWNQPTDY